MTSSEIGAEKTGTTLLTLVVDRSGSMAGIREDMEGGIKTLIEEQAKEEGACVVTLTQFDDEYEVVADGVPAAEMEPYRLVPRGRTALLDAIGRTIAMVHSRIENFEPAGPPGERNLRRDRGRQGERKLRMEPAAGHGLRAGEDH